MSEQLLHISELFHSIQGEGDKAGTPMLFIRLAGCNVGEYTPIDLDAPLFPVIPNAHYAPELLRVHYPHNSVCETALGERFLCDTNYKRRYSMSLVEIIDTIKEPPAYPSVCFTGGEPFLWDMNEIAGAVFNEQPDMLVQIETSGTKPIVGDAMAGCWITCSPKKGFLPENSGRVDEFKFVINAYTKDGPTDDDLIASIKDIVGEHPLVFLQPANDVQTCRQDSLQRVLAILRKQPHWRLSVQLHKYLGLQ